jgi:hypothetical protein
MGIPSTRSPSHILLLGALDRSCCCSSVQSAREEAAVMASKSYVTCCTVCGWLLFSLLAVARIQGAHYSVFIIFIPLFIIVRTRTVLMHGFCMRHRFIWWTIIRHLHELLHHLDPAAPHRACP